MTVLMLFVVASCGGLAGGGKGMVDAGDATFDALAT
jgi:hypothetical protein